MYTVKLNWGFMLNSSNDGYPIFEFKHFEGVHLVFFHKIQINDNIFFSIKSSSGEINTTTIYIECYQMYPLKDLSTMYHHHPHQSSFLLLNSLIFL